jgi:hypothetical protein
MAGAIFLLRVPRVGRFFSTAGRQIAVDIEPDATDRDAVRESWEK